MATPLTVARGITLEHDKRDRKVLVGVLNGERINGQLVDRATTTFNTGLFDKYGVEIFEGDTLSTEAKNNDREWLVRYDDSELDPFFLTSDDNSDPVEPKVFFRTLNKRNSKHYAVVGNIYGRFPDRATIIRVQHIDPYTYSVVDEHAPDDGERAYWRQYID